MGKPVKREKKKTGAEGGAAASIEGKKLVARKSAGKKAARKSTAGKVAAKGKKSAGASEAADPFEEAKRTMKGSVPAIVKTMVKKAKEGSCTHAKTLLEMTGAKHMFGPEAEMQDRGEPWAKLVLERLDEAENGSEKEVAGDRVESPAGD
jgi:hypothetical protein